MKMISKNLNIHGKILKQMIKLFEFSYNTLEIY